MAENQALVVAINSEINKELADPKVVQALLATTFKGLDAISMKQAMVEGMIRGFKFKDFLEKNIYAIAYGKSYSLMTSIDYARKIGMRSDIVGKKAPIYEIEKDADGKEKIISCTVTVQKMFKNGHIGDFTATVYFSEYDKKANLWLAKPKTMIAKVAEMHALRMACPEELSQSYIEEELDPAHDSRIKTVTAKVAEGELKMGKFLKKHGKDENQEREVEETTPAEDSKALGDQG